MNVRDLSQYIKNLCGTETLEQLGTNQELLLQKIYGCDPSHDQAKSVIQDAASFASNAEEQLFYEFVQNAYDASANSLFFFANEQYLVVLNNGEPFYTDSDIFESQSVRDGQLYNFLAKGKSAKRNDSDKLGKYGQGSKLLYTLLTDVNESEENEELLIQALYDGRKGPYLISWYNRAQLANLLEKPSEWTFAEFDDYKENILFAKILMTYYPIAPGRSEEWFPSSEAINAIEAFDNLVNPRRNLHSLDKGTALIIPLGKGKYEKIISEDNLSRVRMRLGCFAAITKSQERNNGKTVEHICVMGEDVEQHEVQSVFVNFESDGKPFYYHFAFNPVFAKKDFVNLFKGLPILEAKLGLGFIIDSQRFEVDNSRQHISDKDKTKGQLVKAFSELVIVLKELKNDNPQKFDSIYKSIVATKCMDGEDFDYITEAFQEVFVPFFEEFVPTSSGEYEKKENVRTFCDDYLLPLKEIGVTKYKWIDDSIREDLSRHGVVIDVINLGTVLSDADSNCLESWIKSLPAKEYSRFHEFVDKHKDKPGVSDKKTFRSNLGNLFSWSELKGTINVYYPNEDGMQFGECEHIGEVLTCNKDLYLYELFEKIKTNIDSFRVSDSTKDDAANLLEYIAKNSSHHATDIKNKILLLQNRHGDYQSFKNLLKERPKDTILFDNYLVKGYIPDAIKRNHWLLDPATNPTECWQWVREHWLELQQKEEWGADTHTYIQDIKSIYHSAGISATDTTWKLTLYLDEDGKPIYEERTIVNNDSRLTEDEYNYLGRNVSHLHLIPFAYRKELTEAPFSLDTVQSRQIVNESLSVDEKLLQIFIKITDNYLNNYRTQEIKGDYLITKSSKGFNYIDSVSDDLKEELLDANFYHIPTKVQEIMNAESTQYGFVSNEFMLKKAIEELSDPLKLLPFVQKANDNVKRHFFTHLKDIIIDDKLEEDDLRWRVIDFATSLVASGNNYTNNVFGHIRHKGEELPSSITQQFVTVGKNQYNIYELIECYAHTNQAIDSFLKCLPSNGARVLFKDYYYSGKAEVVPAQDLFEQLKDNPLNLDQLQFCLDYKLNQH